MRGDRSLRNERAWRDAVGAPGEEHRDADESRHFRHDGGSRTALHAPAEFHDEQPVQAHVDKPGNHLHEHGIGNLALVADKRQAAGGYQLEGNAERDHLEIEDRLVKRLPLPAERAARRLCGNVVGDGDGYGHRDEQDERSADNRLFRSDISPAATDGRDHSAAHADARSQREDQAHERIGDVDARKPRIAHRVADEDAVNDAVYARKRKRHHGGDDELEITGNERERNQTTGSLRMRPGALFRHLAIKRTGSQSRRWRTRVQRERPGGLACYHTRNRYRPSIP